MLNIKQEILNDVLVKYQDFANHLSDVLSVLPDTDELQERINNLFSMPQKELDLNLAPPSDVIRDYRFTRLILNNYRKFDIPSGKVKFYSLPFGEADKSMSTFVLGDNGSGKSSLFNSMEYLFTGTIAEAEYRGIKDLPWYIGRRIGENPSIYVATKPITFSLSEQENIWKNIGVDLSRFFFSENSIYELSKHMALAKMPEKVDWIPFFCYALGLEDIMEFVKGEGLFQDIRTRLEQVQNLISKDLTQQEKEIEAFIRDSSVVLTPNTTNELIKLQKSLSTILAVMNESDLQKVIEQLVEALPDDVTYIYSINEFRNYLEALRERVLKIFTDKKDVADASAKKKKEKVQNTPPLDEEEYKKSLHQEVAKLTSSVGRILENKTSSHLPMDDIFDMVKTYVSNKKILDSNGNGINISQMLEDLDNVREMLSKNLLDFLKNYIDDDFISLIEGTLSPFIENDETLKVIPMDKGTVLDSFGFDISVNDIPVNKYFNTFRFRLFCLCMIAAFDFKMMQRAKFLFPLVFDDIFYANDYKNKSLLYRFFEVLTQGAKKFLQSEDQLQIIFFSHDEQFINSLFLNKEPFKNAIMARLLDSRYLGLWYKNKPTAQTDMPSYKVINEFNRCMR